MDGIPEISSSGVGFTTNRISAVVLGNLRIRSTTFGFDLSSIQVETITVSTCWRSSDASLNN